MSTGAALRAGGWDPVLLVSQVRVIARRLRSAARLRPARWVQIILLQTVHYLALSVLTPFAAGGAPAVGLVMDWRELAGAVDLAHGGGTAYAGGRALGSGVQVLGPAQDAPGTHAWGLAACWMLAALAECVADIRGAWRAWADTFLLARGRYTSLSAGRGSCSTLR